MRRGGAAVNDVGAAVAVLVVGNGWLLLGGKAAAWRQGSIRVFRLKLILLASVSDLDTASGATSNLRRFPYIHTYHVYPIG